MRAHKIIYLFVLSQFFYCCSNNADKIYYPNGKIKRTVEVLHGKWNGTYISYYQNGQINIKGQYINGIKTGMHLFYDSTGRVEKEILYGDNERNKTEILYFPNGHIYQIISFRNGEASGAVLQYYPNGKTYFMTNYKDGRKNGECYFFSSHGDKIIQYELYKDGRLVYYKKYDSISGGPIYEFRNMLIISKDTFYEGEYFEAKIKIFGPLDQNNRIDIPDGVIAFMKGEKESYANPISFTGDSAIYKSSRPLKVGDYFLDVVICMDIDTAHNSFSGDKKFKVLPKSTKLSGFKTYQSLIGVDNGIIRKWTFNAKIKLKQSINSDKEMQVE